MFDENKVVDRSPLGAEPEGAPSNWGRVVLGERAWLHEANSVALPFAEHPGVRPDGRRTMRALVELIVRALVDRQECVRITEVEGRHAHVIEVEVAKEDIGKVIGKGGRTLMPFARS